MFLTEAALNKKIEYNSKYLPQRAKDDITFRYQTMNLIHNRGYHLSEEQRKIYLADRPINPRYNIMNEGAPSFTGAFQSLENKIINTDYPKPNLPVQYQKYQKLLDIVYDQNVLNKTAKTIVIFEMSTNKYVANVNPFKLGPSLDSLIRNIINHGVFLLFYNDPKNDNLLSELQKLSISSIKDDKILDMFINLSFPKPPQISKQGISNQINPEELHEAKSNLDETLAGIEMLADVEEILENIDQSDLKELQESSRLVFLKEANSFIFQAFDDLINKINNYDKITHDYVTELKEAKDKLDDNTYQSLLKNEKKDVVLIKDFLEGEGFSINKILNKIMESKNEEEIKIEQPKKLNVNEEFEKYQVRLNEKFKKEGKGKEVEEEEIKLQPFKDVEEFNGIYFSNFNDKINNLEKLKKYNFTDKQIEHIDELYNNTKQPTFGRKKTPFEYTAALKVFNKKIKSKLKELKENTDNNINIDKNNQIIINNIISFMNGIYSEVKLKTQKELDVQNAKKHYLVSILIENLPI